MTVEERKIVYASLAVFSLAGAALAVLFGALVEYRPATSPAVQEQAGSTTAVIRSVAVYGPPSLDRAPEHLRDAIQLGYNIINETHKYAGQYTGNKLECRSCHLNSGITQGGRNGGLSLVGVGATYPKYRTRQDFAVDLVQRTTDCFERSMNGKAPPPNGREMQALMAYYQWISKDLPIYADVPWLGTPPWKAARGDGSSGSRLYAGACSSCHGPAGGGTLIAPPLWGAESFNDGAGMHRPETFAAFTLYNMPRGNPTLSQQQAADVAAYVTAQPRPHFTASER